ncbi:DUF3048 domain-containing protein [Demequina sp.]|uniref:DUF3048 domain-containing protein n=1 Tax=Demequina sp. TaxID=2050685 RepID=UPI003D0B5CB1
MIRVRSAGLAALTVAVALAVGACAPADTVEPNTTVQASASPVDREPAPSPPADPKPAVTWPLTGLDATTASASDLKRPALSIKIENTEAARPQTNLEFADVVFEENVEYGISRLIAVYQSNYPDEVGPIRSMRPMDKNIMGSLGGPLVFSGAQRRFINDAAASGTVLIAQDVGSYGFFRTSDKPAPHNLHGHPADFAEQSKGAVAPKEQWAFAYPGTMATATLLGKPTSKIDIRFSSYSHPHWEWNADKSLWMRYEYDSPHKAASGTQLSATNVVVIYVTVRETGATSVGMSVPETLVAGEKGKGFVATGGKRIAVTWSKKSRTAPFVLKDSNGDAVAMAPGQTWWELVPTNGEFATKVTFSD